jgi:high-affinity iron transporter
LNIIWQAIAAWGSPDPLAEHLDSTAAGLDIGVLVFREGLECILVLAAVTAGMAGARTVSRRTIAAGAGAAFI